MESLTQKPITADADYLGVHPPAFCIPDIPPDGTPPASGLPRLARRPGTQTVVLQDAFPDGYSFQPFLL
ncbi:hypothetical protein D3C73_1575100 [compost metagenome]